MITKENHGAIRLGGERMLTYQIRTLVNDDPSRVYVRALKTDDEPWAVQEFERVCKRLADEPEAWQVELQAVMTNTMLKRTV